MQLSYRWVIIAAGALMTCVAAGAMFSLAVFLQPMSRATGWSRAGISSAMTLNFLTMGIAALFGAASATATAFASSCCVGRCCWASPWCWPARRPRPRSSSSSTAFWWGCCRHLICPADCGGVRLVRDQPQPRRLARLCRLGRGADDDLAVCALADLDLRLAYRHADHRHSVPGCCSSPPRYFLCWRRPNAVAVPKGQNGERGRPVGRRRPCARYSFGCWR